MATPEPTPPDPLQKAIDAWRARHKLREDEPLLLCLELFRIHQSQWDEIRRRELPSFSEVREVLGELREDTVVLQRQTSRVAAELARFRGRPPWVDPGTLGFLLTAAFALLAGFVMGRFLR